MSKNALIKWIDENSKIIASVAKDLWENPEIASEEVHAARSISTLLKAHGFKVKDSDTGAATAFVGEYGSGKPIIGILGEYDALAGLSQKVSTVEEPLKEGGPGHGCGHNLLGAGALGAALAIKESLKSGMIKGTIRYYGCPAEEELSGKVLMARAGLFEDLDLALTWHPLGLNFVWGASSLALKSIKFKFHGIAAHAAAAPEAGRSALDAVELMNVAANYLREHIPEKARLHYVITNGGNAPNIVPDEAEVWYYIRAPKRDQVEDISNRLFKIAKGSTLMTETTVTVKIESGCYEFMPNKTIGKVMAKNMAAIGSMDYDEKEREFGANLVATIPQLSRLSALNGMGAPTELLDHNLHEGVLEALGEGSSLSGSTDVGDVSALLPTAQLACAAWPIGVPPHSWQATAASGSTMGTKAAILAAKNLAATAYDLFMDESLVKEAKEEFRTYADPLKYSPTTPGQVDLTKLT
jgi:aminobenzoyl-glutamate utilization protein B